MKYHLLCRLSDVPDGAIVRKKLGVKRYTVKRSSLINKSHFKCDKKSVILVPVPDDDYNYYVTSASTEVAMEMTAQELVRMAELDDSF